MPVGFLALALVVLLILKIERAYKKIEKKRFPLFDIIVALGIVFGDIGTSILYTWNETFFHTLKDGSLDQVLQFTPENIKGTASLIFWSLVIVMCMKYASLVLMAHHEEEGGPFALLALLSPFASRSRFVAFLTGTGLVMSTCFLIGEGLITPPISCLSAVEGLKVLWPETEPWVMYIVLGIFVGLFSIQKFGTQKLGTVFGCTTLVWFMTVGGVGAVLIGRNPEIMDAFDPRYAVAFLMANGFKGSVMILGSAVLCMTGGEALYADRGHFGRGPIVGAWYKIAMPSLVLNYFGQGAYLLGGGEVTGGNIFYSSANTVLPQFAQPLLIMLATAATIIASQALISGVFSLISVARTQDYVPPHAMQNTSDEHHPMKGQVYIWTVNLALWAGCSLLVIAFPSSGKLAAAYGLAVTGVMTITTLSMIAYVYYVRGWKVWQIVPVFGLFLIVDLAYFGANMVKFTQGGWVPFAIGSILFLFLKNRKSVRSMFIGPALQDFATVPLSALKHLMDAPATELEASDLTRTKHGLQVLVSRSITNLNDPIPTVLLGHIAQQDTVPAKAVFVHVKPLDVPVADCRYIVDTGNGLHFLTLQYGFREVPDLEAAQRAVELEYAMRDPKILVGDEELTVSPRVPRHVRWWIEFYKIVHKNAKKVYQFLYPHGGWQVEGRVVKVHIPILIDVDEKGRLISKVVLKIPQGIYGAPLRNGQALTGITLPPTGITAHVN